ncbi:MAG TPA: Rossmann-like and DUF2520 domain-containing protein [Pedococcus sp.]|nr:Rossmann-like and DUF2520 domain-containing protein [Pedococcus sp.]
MDVAVVGAGRLGTAVAVRLAGAGHRIVAVAGRRGTAVRAATHLPGVPVLPEVRAAAAAEVVVIGTPDDAIEATAASLAAAIRPGAWVLHLSGALGLGALAAVAAAGARRLALHPLQTFPDVASALERLPGCPVAVTAEDEEGFTLGERLARDLGGRPFRLADDRRALYHAAAVFASNYVVTASGAASELLAAAGVPDPAGALVPLQRASLENVERIGADRALTGPAVRGDAGTILRNLEALKQDLPGLIPAYVGMARAALDLADRAGRLPPGGRAAVENVLAAWT